MVAKLTTEQKKWYDRVRLRATLNASGQASDMGAPYLAPAIFKLSVVPVAQGQGLWAMAVDDRGRVYINFDYCMTRDLDWAAGALVHEVWHVLRHHAKRAKHTDVRDFDKWNKAGDLEINTALPQRFVKSMTDILYPKHFKDETGTVFPDGKTAEWYYNNLQDQKQQGGKQGQSGQGQDQGQGGGQGQQGDQGDSQGQGGGKGDQDQQGQGGGQGDAQGQDGKPGEGECGSGAGGQKRQYEVEGNADGETPEWSETDREFMKREVAKRIREQSQKSSSNGIGTLPGTLLEWADVVLAPPRVRWQDVFRALIHTAVKYRRGYKTINRRKAARRQPVADLIVPQWNDSQLTAAAALDNSGSNLGNIPGALTEVFAMLRVAGIKELQFFTVDTEVAEVQRLRRASDRVRLEGGGGTDMRVGFRRLAELGVDVGILFTDSQTPWPSEQEYESLLAEGKTRFIIAALIGSDYDAQAADQIPAHLKDITVRVDLRDAPDGDVFTGRR
jgi:predicted metal-dependent peptidase